MDRSTTATTSARTSPVYTAGVSAHGGRRNERRPTKSCDPDEALAASRTRAGTLRLNRSSLSSTPSSVAEPSRVLPSRRSSIDPCHGPQALVRPDFVEFVIKAHVFWVDMSPTRVKLLDGGRRCRRASQPIFGPRRGCFRPTGMAVAARGGRTRREVRRSGFSIPTSCAACGPNISPSGSDDAKTGLVISASTKAYAELSIAILA